jgi:hypothetical protein
MDGSGCRWIVCLGLRLDELVYWDGACWIWHKAGVVNVHVLFFLLSTDLM